MPIVTSIIDSTAHNYNCVWWGDLSRCASDGAIINFMKETLDSIEAPTTLIIPLTDGIVANRDLSIFQIHSPEHMEQYLFTVSADTTPVIALLCTRNYWHPRKLLLPLDDDCFVRGVSDVVLSRATHVKWEDKKPIAFWRGWISNWNYRSSIVAPFIANSNFDMKFVEVPQGADKSLLGQKVATQEYLHHKYILVIDGACIASSHQWVFASGSVPILASHPDNDFWFKRYLVPMVHYVPAYTPEEVKEKVEWLIANDEKACEIAENAVRFADYYLSSGFQQYHLTEEIKRILA